MTEQEFDRLSPEEREAQEAVRRLSVRPLGPAFRRSLGDQFVSGSLDAILSRAEPLDPDRVAEPVPDAEGNEAPVGVPVTVLRAWWRPVVLTLAAAAVWIVVSLRGGDSGPMWEFIASQGVGTVWVDEVSHDVADLSGVAFDPGVRIRTEGSAQMELVCADLFALELSPGTDLTLPSGGEDGLYLASVRDGVATWVTGTSFPGHELRIEAPDAEVRVHGTTFAVLADDEKTCVSVYEGAVGMCASDGQLHSVGAGRCRRVYRAPQVAPTESELSEGQVASLAHWYARSHELLPHPPAGR